MPSVMTVPHRVPPVPPVTCECVIYGRRCLGISCHPASPPLDMPRSFQVARTGFARGHRIPQGQTPLGSPSSLSSTTPARSRLSRESSEFGTRYNGSAGLYDLYPSLLGSNLTHIHTVIGSAPTFGRGRTRDVYFQ